MRTVLFDVDGVLIHSMFHPDPAKRRVWSEHIEMDFGIDRDIFNQFFRFENFAPIIRGDRPLVEALDEFLPSIGAKIDSLDLIAYWFENDTPLNYTLLQGIKRLQRSADVQVHLATNQEHLRAFHLWRELRFNHIFDRIFYAARLRAVKPEDNFFIRVNEKLGPQSEEPLFFDDSQKNIDAAKQHGWDAVLFETESDFFNHPWIKEQLS
ncbi:HAD-IA family hydrolase [Maritalea sp.]|uniref:HAD-IA family hydrolase n=1 Tax=Maritalea sp. TaxID=2003361 RepID=UPI003EF37224